MSSELPENDARYAETLAGVDPQFSREQQDVALAAVILRSGVLSERKLSEGLQSWTIHGSIPLAEHLVDRKLIAKSSLSELTQEASKWLNACKPSGTDTGRESVITSTLASLDPAGRVSRLMGIQAVVGTDLQQARDHRQALLNYRLVRRIGQGGLGRVWLAFDESLKRHVAIKEITDQDNPAALERFRREAEITGHLEHPGIVPIYQLGEDQGTGHAFYAMRFLGKRTLHDAIMEYHERRTEGDDNPMLIRQLLTDFVNVCQAIGHAHSRKVIHRDLKPENIAIDNFGQVIVIDWGIAKVIGDLNLQESSTDSSMSAFDHQSTLQGQVLGTPMYMAPEQAAGRIDELDERTDIYGLGAILFAILTGAAPHEKTREESQAAGGRDLLSAITGRPTPHAKEVDSDVDEALSAICSKAMARKQYGRYPSATALAEDVQRWMAGEPVSAHNEGVSQRITRWIQHHQALSQIIAACFIVAIVVIATWATAARESQLAARRVLFDELDAYAHEMELQLESTAVELVQDARFMSTLPPIQGIIAARDESLEQSEGEEVWRERLETIYEGLLRANPSYLSISYAEVSEEAYTDIVRVERNASEVGYVRRVPRSRLSTVAEHEFVAQTASLSPGDILLNIRREQGALRSAKRQVRLTAATPVFDENSGSVFGMVTVETDLLSRIVQFLERVEQSSARIFIVDSMGQIWVSEEPTIGVEINQTEQNISELIPNVASFLSGGLRDRQAMEEEGWIADRIMLDPTNPQTTLGVILELVAKD